MYLYDRDGYCGVHFRKIRLRIKDETEREKAEVQAAHADRLQKLQQDFEQQLTDEKDKIRYIISIWSLAYTALVHRQCCIDWAEGQASCHLLNVPP